VSQVFQKPKDTNNQHPHVDGDKGHEYRARALIQWYKDNLGHDFWLRGAPMWYDDLSGTRASPAYAYNSMLTLVAGAWTMHETSANMLKEHDRVSDYWQGPASETFAGIFDAMQKFVAETVNIIDPVQFQGTFLDDSQSSTGWAHNTSLVAKYHRLMWDNLDRQFWYDRAFFDTADVAPRNGYTLIANSRWLDQNADDFAYWSNVLPRPEGWETFVINYYNNATAWATLYNQVTDELWLRYTGALKIYEFLVSDLGREYAPLTTTYYQLPDAPRFPVPKDDNKNKYDPNNPKDSDGDGVPDYLDPYPNDPTKFGPQPPPDIKPPDTQSPSGSPTDGFKPPSGSPTDGFKPPSGSGTDNLKSPSGSPTDGFKPPSGDGLKSPDTGGGPPLVPAGMPPGMGVGGVPPTGKMVTGPNGTGLDVTGNGTPDLSLDGKPLPGGDLPPGSKEVTGPDGRKGIDLNGDGIPDIGLNGVGLPGGSAPPGSRFATGPDGKPGFDVTGNGKPDLGMNGQPLTGGDLPRGSQVVTGPGGQRGIDLNGDGVPDVGFNGQALPGGNAPPGSRLVTGPDGTTGFDITGNQVPDLSLNKQPLANGDLPHGSALVTGPNGQRGIDINHDGVPDIGLDGRALSGGPVPAGTPVQTGPDGRTGYDLNGDGIPDMGFDGKAMPPPPPSAGQLPSNQTLKSPGTDTGGPGAGFGPGGSGGPGVATAPGGPGGGGMYPPMMPPMMGGMGGMGGAGQSNGERERQTWLMEEDEVWEDGDLVATAVLGRPSYEEEEEEPDLWEAPPVKPRPTKGGPRSQRPSQPGRTPGTARW
jgi:hypothetical protein